MNKKKILAFINRLFASKFKEGDEIVPTAEQQELLGAAFPDEGVPDQIIAFLNAKEDNDDVIKASIIAHLATQVPIAGTEAPEGEAPTTEEPATTALAAQALIDENIKLKADNKVLMAQTEPDKPLEIVGKNKNKMNTPKHTTTALFGSAEPYMAMAGRPWNAAAKLVAEKGIGSFVATDFSQSINVDKINEDFGAYARKNIDKIIDIFRDGLNIPKKWKVISNISDELAYAAFAAGEITQGGSSGWKAKNEVMFVPMKAKVFDKKIDITFTGKELKAFEKTWIKSLAIFDDNGSNPYKESFVAFLLMKLMKQARHEDKLGLIKGVFFDNDKLVKPGKAINALNGFIKLAANNMKVHYNPFDLPKLTNANAYDTINSAVKQIPDEYRSLAMQMPISPSDILNYKDGYRREHGSEANYDGMPNHVDGWPNIVFEPITQFEGTGFFCVTTDDNIYVLVDKLGEEESVTAEKSKRDMNLFVDYKLGPHVEMFGMQMEEGNITGFGNQIFFSNNPKDLLEDVAIPATANATTIDVKNHRVVAIGRENTSAANITAISNATIGLVYILKGDSETNQSTVKSGGNLNLGSDCVLTPSTELHLLAQSGGKFIEVDRKDTVASTTIVTLQADATTADAIDGNEFVTQANTQATVITTIENAVAKEVYIIRGGSDVNKTTISNGGVFQLLTSSITLGDGIYIELYYNGTKFSEVKRG